MDALRTDDLTSPLAPFLLASLAIHVLLVFLLPVASIEVPARPAAVPLVPIAGAEGADPGARGLLVPLGSLRMQVIELEVPLSMPAAVPAPPPVPESAPSDVVVALPPAAPAPDARAAETAEEGAAGPATEVPAGPAGPVAGAGAGEGGGSGAGTGSGTGSGTGTAAGIVEPPVIVAMVWPEFPRAARKQLKVPIVLAVHVTAEGRVDVVEVETPSGCPSCEAAAIASAWQLRFQPATRDGAPIAMWTRFPVVFGQR